MFATERGFAEGNSFAPSEASRCAAVCSSSPASPTNSRSRDRRDPATSAVLEGGDLTESTRQKRRRVLARLDNQVWHGPLAKPARDRGREFAGSSQCGREHPLDQQSSQAGNTHAFSPSRRFCSRTLQRCC